MSAGPRSLRPAELTQKQVGSTVIVQFMQLALSTQHCIHNKLRSAPFHQPLANSHQHSVVLSPVDRIAQEGERLYVKLVQLPNAMIRINI